MLAALATLRCRFSRRASSRGARLRGHHGAATQQARRRLRRRVVEARDDVRGFALSERYADEQLRRAERFAQAVLDVVREQLHHIDEN